MDKQLNTQFINSPFTIDPDSSTYIHLLECMCMDSFLAQCAKSQQIFELHRSFHAYPPYHSPHADTGNSSTTCYAPYEKSQHHGKAKSQPFFCAAEYTDAVPMPVPQHTQAGWSNHSSAN